MIVNNFQKLLNKLIIFTTPLSVSWLAYQDARDDVQVLYICVGMCCVMTKIEHGLPTTWQSLSTARLLSPITISRRPGESNPPQQRTTKRVQKSYTTSACFSTSFCLVGNYNNKSTKRNSVRLLNVLQKFPVVLSLCVCWLNDVLLRY